MGSYCPVCDQFVENLDVCAQGEYHRDDEVWYQGEVRTRSKSKKHRTNIIVNEVLRLLNVIDITSEKPEKVSLFEQILIIFKNNKWVLKNNKNLSDVISHKIDVFSDYSQDFRHLKSFKYQLFGEC